MKRIAGRLGQRLLDLFLLSAAYWIAFFLRFDWQLPDQMLKRLLFTWPYLVALQYLVLVSFGVPQFAWRYIGLRETIRIAVATGISCVALLAVRLAAGLTLSATGYAQYALIPTGVILIDAALAFVAVVGIRAVRRIAAEHHETGRRTSGLRQTPTMLIGAGQAGVLVAKELRSRPDLGIEAVGFLDDDQAKVGTTIHGIRVLGTTHRLAELCYRFGAQQALVTIANAPGKDIRRLVMACENAGIPAKIIPGIYEIVGGRVNLSRIRDVAIEDLLGREPVKLHVPTISAFVENKTVMVTGAGGSVGSEICRQVARFRPAKLILVERFENALFEIHRDLQSLIYASELQVQPKIADVTDRERMKDLFALQRPDVIFHAAAHKHVPMMEQNPGEAIKNNILGTMVVADLARQYEAASFVLISTDKAVNPTSIMGATKRVAELYIQSMDSHSDKTNFVAVRFGNVLASNGSVVPIFKQQIARGGPVTVTHPEMRRYFMTIPEAAQLVLQSAALGAGGEVFILDMGEPLRILDLAYDLIRLSGLEPERDIEISITGVRPGEKLFEELSTRAEAAERTAHEKVFVGQVVSADWDVLQTGIKNLTSNTREQNAASIYQHLQALIPEFSGAAPSNAAQVVTLPRRG